MRIGAALGTTDIYRLMVARKFTPQHTRSDVIAIVALGHPSVLCFASCFEQKEYDMPWDMRVVPLFETLADLEQSSDTMR